MNRRYYVRYILALSIVFRFSFLQTLADNCLLDTEIPLFWNGSEGNWGGYLSSKRCGIPFERYLYSLAKKTNTSGEIFPNITQQKYCLSRLNTSEKDAFICGIEKLTSGNGGCSDYSVKDVAVEQENGLRKLDQSCKNLRSESDEGCNSCLGVWEQMAGEGDTCRFSVLVLLNVEELTKRDDKAEQGKKITFITGVEIVAGGVGVILVILAIVWLILYTYRTRRKPPIEGGAQDASFSVESSSVKISLREVHLATDNLSASNFIGQGVAGKVYKGILSNGQLVAVKHIINDGQMETFVREVTSLSHVKHPNLVELLGNCDGEDESFLVYELCHNGNLSEWLFGKHKFLNWIQRLEIAIDCARGLWFLHTYTEGCIVHRDIKPTNILLGTNFEAKLSDFGLSKVICMGNSYVSSEVRGTFGYVDPEYQKNRRVHPSTDVYSFGIVLLQLLSGQRVINMNVNKPMPLSKMAKNLTKGGDITEFADGKLNGEYSVESFELVFKVALSCTGLKQQRPSMGRVVAALEKAHRISQRVRSLDFSFQSV
ncbi:PREDICTED: probable receptor-like protein kinase At3g55450 [Erythranthe guttata]|uniref:probable receptor-like protein kinase At3g55450 n=1 Tax=Erythranthe guttata TaxID=4155 RepID=UPI00064D7F85|nr:PREDICTED: probable receptor-like protein kinase At3g55450 [Erythranthe guttata]|eukprot:XP_012844782.1 PREDICTED: probable receptor-like protein kinase At3g55450 [Erythranthe guttata]